VISLPGDVAASEAPDGKHAVAILAKAVLRPADTELEKLAGLINDAKTVPIFGGEGCGDARNEVLALAAKSNAPVGYSFRGKQWLEHDNPYATGTSRRHAGGFRNTVTSASALSMISTVRWSALTGRQVTCPHRQITS
jgi:pyruvate dehydrogenase (quinone)